MKVLLAVLAGVLLGCGAGPHTRGAGAVAPLSVRAVPWSSGSTPVGHVKAVAEADRVVAVFGDQGAIVLSGGAPVATDPRVTDWTSAETIPGADGSPRWIVGIDGKGRVYYLRAMSSFEDVSSRYGLDGRAVRAAAMLDAARVGFLLDREIAMADGKRVTRYPTPALLDLSGGPRRAVATGHDALVVFDPSPLATRSFALPGVTHAVVGADGRIYATTPRAVYASRADGRLGLVYDAEADTVHGLVASGQHVWFADGTELGIVDGDHVAETTGAGVRADAGLAPSPSGDVWVIGAGELRRFARAEPEAPLAAEWQSNLQPIFARVCSACHLPSGPSGTDLSTPEAWESERNAIRDRVLVTRSMPPQGHPLSDTDRGVIAAWVQRQSAVAAAPQH